MDETDTSAVPGFERFDLATGARYLKIHYYADPSKDEAWLEQVRREMADTPREFEVEILMRELVIDGKPVYLPFREDYHAPAHYAQERIPPVAYSKYVMGWDCGTASIQPAAILLQLTPKTDTVGRMVHALLEVTSEPGTSLEAFVPAALNAVRELYPEILLGVIRHGGDESGRARSGVNGESAFDVMHKHGVTCHPVSNAWQARRSAVDRLLMSECGGGRPMFILSRKHCPSLFKGFLGGYRLRKVAGMGNSKLYGDPVKDEFSHPHDSLQYAAVLAWQLMK
ncbi:MAG: hypothetical protein KF784_02240 [Fimbriimonadaceae bacterium]|nr:hypothetical protein [Fimbriimonadaceae bacterium]